MDFTGNKRLEESIHNLIRISGLTHRVFDNDETRALEWITQANDLFFGRSPLEVTLAGNGESVIELLREWLE